MADPEKGDDEEDWFERALSEDRDGDGEGESQETDDGADDPASKESIDPTERSDGETSTQPEGQPEQREEAGAAGGSGEETGSAFADAFDESTPGEGLDFDVEEGDTDFDIGEEGGDFDVGEEGGDFDVGEGGGDFDVGGQSADLDVEGGGDESFGFDLGGESAEATFDDEDFESDIPRIDLGIEGLDEMVQGGVPERTLMVSIGGAGTGKTTFGLQFLNKALAEGEQGVYITLEESRQRVIQSAEEKGWEFETFEEEGRLAIIDLDPVEMANSLTSIRNELPRLVESFGASRLVLDSVSLLEMMYDDQATRRTEIYDFARALKAAGVTTMLTSEADADNPFASRYGIIEYLTDAVFVLRHVRPDDFRETRLAIEIQKIRDANHSRETKPYEITDTGISVYREANIF